jgi:hypothetical protein
VGALQEESNLEMWIKSAIVVAIILAVMTLGSFLVRDFRRGVIFTHLGTYRRDEQPRGFWFWAVNYFGLLFLALCAAVVGFLFLPSP